ncbi:hypothetical protein DFAR_650002 [Desulfarculales bacterium]
MDAGGLMILGLGLQPPWRLVGQRVDTDKQPHEAFWEVAADQETGITPARSVAGCARLTTSTNSPGVTYLNLFQHHCYVTARVPQVDYCPDHGTK